MKLTTTFITLSLLALSSGIPITSPALSDGTVNVARGDRPPNDANFELVDESSHFGVGKRAVPIDSMNDPAAVKAVAINKVIDDGDLRKHWDHAALGTIKGDNGEVVRRIAQHTGVQQCAKVNCPSGLVIYVESCALLTEDTGCCLKPWYTLSGTLATFMHWINDWSGRH